MATVHDAFWIETPLQCKHPGDDRLPMIYGICHPFCEEMGKPAK